MKPYCIDYETEQQARRAEKIFVEHSENKIAVRRVGTSLNIIPPPAVAPVTELFCSVYRVLNRFLDRFKTKEVRAKARHQSGLSA